MPVSQVKDSSFYKEVIKSSCPVLVDFWAPWCGPCRMIAPVIDEIAREYSSTLKVVKLDVDDNPDTAKEYGIRSIPTVMVFINGKKVDTVIGAVSKSALLNKIYKYLSL
uniref:Thioredoxin n=1 Tax=Caloglossa intermedia TaxID=100879 RepID=A0A1Z1M6P1_9FLOR|nr:thioredoxin [Caloglossa intermedia]ARW61424.1 thioredoxin [Caloglossa intermedia]